MGQRDREGVSVFNRAHAWATLQELGKVVLMKSIHGNLVTYINVEGLSGYQLERGLLNSVDCMLYSKSRNFCFIVQGPDGAGT